MPVRSPSPDPGPRAPLPIGGALALAAAIGNAWALHWTGDDAYISFRYARHLVAGHGLVFNAGERVEGYSNFLWTLWTALGMRLGWAPERWADVWGIAAYALVVLLLVRFSAWRSGGSGWRALPVAAVAAAFHRDLAIYATSGLETAAFTLVVTLVWLVLAGVPLRPRPANAAGDPSPLGPARAAVGGLLAGVAILSRPDGVVIAAVAGLWVLATGRPRLRTALAYAGVMAAIVIPYALWKLAMYGDLLPNTYYAKSAGSTWLDQGLAYVGLYFHRYWVLALAVPLAWLAVARPAAARPLARPAMLAALLALGWTAYVVKVGGDFMYARFMIPVTPLLLVLLEVAWAAALGNERARRAPALAAAALGIAAIAIAPRPVAGETFVRGIVDERDFYLARGRELPRRIGEDLRRLAAGLPVSIVFYGGTAIIAYHSDVPVAIEASTGLTDRTIARLPLAARGRVGHEKAAPFSYLVDQRRATLYLGHSRILSDSLSAYVPLVPLRYDSLTAMVLTWDPRVMDELRRRGAKCDDFLAELDRMIADLPNLPDAFVAEVYAKAKRFYFDGFSDPAREAPFRDRLGLGGRGAP